MTGTEPGDLTRRRALLGLAGVALVLAVVAGWLLLAAALMPRTYTWHHLVGTGWVSVAGMSQERCEEAVRIGLERDGHLAGYCVEEQAGARG